MSVSKFLTGFKGSGGFLTSKPSASSIVSSARGLSGSRTVTNSSGAIINPVSLSVRATSQLKGSTKNIIATLDAFTRESSIKKTNLFNTQTAIIGQTNTLTDFLSGIFGGGGNSQLPTIQPQRTEIDGPTGPIETSSFTDSFSSGFSGIQNILGPTGIVIALLVGGVLLLKK